MSLIFGIIPAWYVSNYKFFGRKFIDLILYLPLAIPTYIMAFTYSEILSFTGPFKITYDLLQIEVLGVILAFSILGNVSYLSVYMLYRAPYLPELAVGPEVAKLSAKGYLIMILSQIFFMGFFVGIGRAFGGTNPYINMRSACIAAVIITSVLALIVLKYMGYREASIYHRWYAARLAAPAATPWRASCDFDGSR